MEPSGPSKDAEKEPSDSSPSLTIPLHIDGLRGHPPTASEPGLPDNAGMSVGPYAVEHTLGRGGQGTVFRATDRRSGRAVALKVLRADLASSAEYEERFRREAAIASSLDHPGICRVYETGIDGSYRWIAMQLVQGETLAKQILRAQTPAREIQNPSSCTVSERILGVLDIVEKTARSLHVAHEAGVVHRDVKPANIMVTESGLPVLLDFGLAQCEQPGLLTLTRTGDLLGTPAYMSPEQVLGLHSLDRRTDVWSLGVTLYELLTLTRPFRAPTQQALCEAICRQDPVNPVSLCASLSKDLATVVMTALEKEPNRRYQTAADLADELVRVRGRHPILARRIGPLGRLARWSRRNPAIAVLIALFLLSLMSGLGVSIWLLREALEARAAESQARGRAESTLTYMLTKIGDRVFDLGQVELLFGVGREAEAYFRDYPPDPTDGDKVHRYAKGMVFLTNAHLLQTDYGKAAEVAERVLSLLDCHLAIDPTNQRALEDRSLVRDLLATTLEGRGDLIGALELLKRDERELRRALAGTATPSLRQSLGTALCHQVPLLREHEGTPVALAVAKEAAELLRTVSESGVPGRARSEVATNYVQALVTLADELENSSDVSGAEAELRRGLAIMESIVREAPEHLNNRRTRLMLGQRLADLFVDNEQVADALQQLEILDEEARAIIRIDPERREVQRDLAVVLRKRGDLLGALGRFDEARGHLEESLALIEKMLLLDPKHPTWTFDRVRLKHALAVHWMRTDPQKALETLTSFDFLPYAREANSPRPTLRISLECGIHHLLMAQCSPWEEKEEHFEKARQAYKKALERAPNHPTLLFNKVDVLRFFAQFAVRDEQWVLARRLLQEGEEDLEVYLSKNPPSSATEQLRAAFAGVRRRVERN